MEAAVICSIVVYTDPVAFYSILISPPIDLNNTVQSGFLFFSSVQCSRSVQSEMHSISRTVYPEIARKLFGHKIQTCSKPAGLNASSLLTASRRQLSASPSHFHGTRHKSHPEARIPGL